MALEALSILGGALAMAQVGDVYIASITNKMNVIYGQNGAAPNALDTLSRHFTFRYEDEFSSDLSLPNFIVQSKEFFGGFTDDRKNICLIVSDGHINKQLVRTAVAEAEQNDHLYIYIILDKTNPSESIINYKTTTVDKVDGKTKMVITPFLEDFPFRYYLVVNVG
jgi:midasin (ATPase involved in ribosome maturation)